MKIFLTLIAVFAGSVVLDGMILPGLFHIYGSLLEFVFLASVLIVYGDEPMFLIWGLVAALMLELWSGFYLGSVMVAWVAAVAVWRACTRILSIEPSIHSSRLSVINRIAAVGLGYMLAAVMSVVFFAVEKYIYGDPVTWYALSSMASSLGLWVMGGIGILVCTFLLRLPGVRSLPAVGKFYI